MPLVSARPRFCLAYLLWGPVVGGQAIVGRDHWSSSYQGLSYRRSSYRGSRPSELKLLGASYHRYDVDKRQARFGGRKNDRLIGKKPPNPIGTEEKNQGRKVLVVV